MREFPDVPKGYYPASHVDDLERCRYREICTPIYPDGHPLVGQTIPDGEPIGEFGAGHHVRVGRVLWPEAAQRVDEMLVARDCWHEQCLIVRDAVGYTAADEAYDRHYELIDPVEAAIIATAAQTIDGLRVKARLYKWCRADEEINVDQRDTADDRTASSIIRDLLLTAA